MTKRPKIARTVSSLRRALAPFRNAEESIALVPTMGALHRGHLTLVREARRRAKRVVVSIFVNPTQFAPHEDFSRYPRNLSADLKALAEAKTDLVWVPTVAVMYPPGFATRIVPEGAAKASLEDKFRPNFFDGVATVVSKLFLQVGPAIAVFGQKDYQQLRVITQMVKDLNLPIKLVGMPIVREPDGLALSSRNAYLSAAERAAAATLYCVLKQCASHIRQDQPIAGVLTAGRAEIIRAGFTLDYLEARHALSLAPVTTRKTNPVRLLVAATIGRTRLIDNVGV